MDILGYTYDHRPLYHGTPKEFDTLKLNQNGILWLTPNLAAATKYAQKYYVKTPVKYLWTVKLKGGAKVLDLSDLSDKKVRSFYEAINESRKSGFGPIDEKDWPKWADFGLLEGYRWAKGFLKKKGVDAVTCSDTVDSSMPHDSIAVLKLSCIEAATKEQIAADDSV